jgi:hypothetical protein
MEPTPTLTLDVDGVPTPAERRPLWWHLAGKTYTASGYGKRIPTEHVVRLEGRWRRVYCCIFSNAGTCYVEGPRDTATGKRGAWRVVRGA